MAKRPSRKMYHCETCDQIVHGPQVIEWHMGATIYEDNLAGLVLRDASNYVVLRRSDEVSFTHNRVFYADEYSSKFFSKEGFDRELFREQPKKVTGPTIRDGVGSGTLKELSPRMFNKVCAKLMQFFEAKYASITFQRNLPPEEE